MPTRILLYFNGAIMPLSTRRYEMEAKLQCSRRRRDWHGYVRFHRNPLFFLNRLTLLRMFFIGDDVLN